MTKYTYMVFEGPILQRRKRMLEHDVVIEVLPDGTYFIWKNRKTGRTGRVSKS